MKQCFVFIKQERKRIESHSSSYISRFRPFSNRFSRTRLQLSSLTRARPFDREQHACNNNLIIIFIIEFDAFDGINSIKAKFIVHIVFTEALQAISRRIFYCRSEEWREFHT